MGNSDRIARLAEKLEECEALMIDDPIDLYYLTGLDLSLGRLIIQKNGESTLLVDGRYHEVCQHLSFVQVELWDWRSTMPCSLPKKIGFDALKMTYASYMQVKELTQATLIPLQGPVLECRMHKEPGEVEKIQKAATLCSRGVQYALSILKEGVSEKALAQEVEIFWLQQGGERLSFDPIIAFGENSSKPHHRASDRALKKGDLVLLDMGICVNHYHSDMTRVVFWGSAPAQIKEIYKLVYEAAARAYAICFPGTTFGELDEAARHFIEASGHPFVHGLGHGVGLEVHEKPRLRTGIKGSERPLESGMVITIEPGIYLPGVGGVRLEDLVLITEDGYERLSGIGCPSSLMEI